MLESISHDDVASMLGLASTKHDGKKEKVSERSGSVKKDKVMVDIGVYVGKPPRTSPTTPWPLRPRMHNCMKHKRLHGHRLDAGAA